MIPLGLDLAALAIVAVVVVVTGWLYHYARERDAESATESVAGTMGTLALGSVTVVTVIVQQGAETLSGVGDIILSAAPWLGQVVMGGLGWLGIAGWIELTPRTWLIAVGAIIVVMAMIDQGR